MAAIVGVQFQEAEFREMGIVAGLKAQGIDARPLRELDVTVPTGHLAFVVGWIDLQRLNSELRVKEINARNVIVVENASPLETRTMLRAGATAVLDPSESAASLAHLLRFLREAEQPVGVLALSHLKHLQVSLEETPVDLSEDDRALLRLLTSCTIEEAGRRLGYSRRQIQRRFAHMCDRLGFDGHLDAAVTATRWGLTGGRTRGTHNASALRRLSYGEQRCVAIPSEIARLVTIRSWRMISGTKSVHG